MANAAGDDADHDLVILRVVDLDLFDGEGLIRTTENGGFHFDSFVTWTIRLAWHTATRQSA